MNYSSLFMVRLYWSPRIPCDLVTWCVQYLSNLLENPVCPSPAGDRRARSLKIRGQTIFQENLTYLFDSANAIYPSRRRFD